MNNLLQSLSAQRLKLRIGDADLKRLLSTVKETRGSESKLSDAFYDSLEGVLQDLRTVTIDNRDAEAFLKPVSKIDYPDYSEIIKEPMDLQTMLKKVKQKQYKSKADFANDLELIWSNCFLYNTGDNHPLRLCAKRLKEKAKRLLKNITDKRDRIDPPVPPDLTTGYTPPPPPPPPPPPRVNGTVVNGHTHPRSETPLSNQKAAESDPTPAPGSDPAPAPESGPDPVPATTDPPATDGAVPVKVDEEEVDPAFANMPAFIRTPAGMSMFMQLDRELEKLDYAYTAGPSALNASNGYHDGPRGPSASIVDKLERLVNHDSDIDGHSVDTFAGGVGEKRKLFVSGDYNPRKKVRSEPREPCNAWWEAVTSPALMANGVPILYGAGASSQDSDTIPYLESFGSIPPPPGPIPIVTITPPAASSTESLTIPLAVPLTIPSTVLPTAPPASSLILPPPVSKKESKKRKRTEPDGTPHSLLDHINNNVRTIKRVRKTHDKFLSLNLGAEEGGSAGNTAGFAEPPVPTATDDSADVKIDERPWRSRGTGLEVGREDSDECLHWMGGKILEHAGFQSTSKVALDVFADVAAEYLMNVGRTFQYFCDNYSQQMTGEEIILHSLFEGGVTHVRDLERYITDDVIRYGHRLNELDKKMTNAYNEVTTVEALDDDAFFGEEDEEEEGELLMGNFADAFGDDFLGLRELGIASELGLQSLTIPKKLLKGKNKQRNATDGKKPTEPPPAYPPPAKFEPLQSSEIDKHIGLLKPYLMRRFNEQASRAAPPLPPPFIQPPPGTKPAPTTAPAQPPRALSPISSLERQIFADQGLSHALPGPSTSSAAPGPSGATSAGAAGPSKQATPPPLLIPNPAATSVSLPDDPLNPARTKIGPLGQILKPNANAGGAKKKAKANNKDAASGAGAGQSAGATRKNSAPAANGTGASGSGQQGNTTTGTGTKKVANSKKKGNASNVPPVVAAKK